MADEPYVLELERDRTWREPITLKGDNVGLNLSGKTVVFHLRRERESADFLTLSSAAIANSTNGSRLIMVNEAVGELDLHISNEETALMNFERGFFSFTIEYDGMKIQFGKADCIVRNP